MNSTTNYSLTQYEGTDVLKVIGSGGLGTYNGDMLKVENALTGLESLKATKVALAAEASTRSDADTTLTNNLATETTNRISADTTLTTNLATEVSDRKAAITQEVTDRNAAIATETTARTNADAGLNTAISNETTNRQAAITQEVTDRNSAVSSAIATEVTNRDTAIATETTSRTSADALGVHLAGTETMTSGKGFAKGAVFYGQDTLPTGLGSYVAAYVNPTYTIARVLAYNGSAYQPLALGAMPTAGVFGLNLLADGTATFGYGMSTPKLLLTATAPTSSTATGTKGEVRQDATYIYICTATNTWKRVALSTW